MTARLIKTATKWQIPHEKDRFSSLQHFRVCSLGYVCKKHEGIISLVKRRHMMCHVKNYHSCKGRRMHSNVIRKGQEDTTKRKKNDNNKQKKVYIQKTKQKIKTNKRKQRSFLSLYFSLRAAVGSRIIQSQEPERSARKNWRGKTKREKISPRFHRVRFLKHAPVSTIWTLRSFSSFFAAKPHGNACYTG